MLQFSGAAAGPGHDFPKHAWIKIKSFVVSFPESNSLINASCALRILAACLLAKVL